MNENDYRYGEVIVDEPQHYCNTHNCYHSNLSYELHGCIPRDIIPISFYIASKTIHAPKWVELSNKYNIISSWINEYLPGATNDRSDLAIRCIEEAQLADITILYCEPHEIHKGSLIEVGAALGAGKQVRCVGMCKSISNVFSAHPNWKGYNTIEAALNDEYESN